MSLLIKNARLRDQDQLHDILIEKDRIEQIAPHIDAPEVEVIDARGNLTTPSLIDPHIHLDKVNILDVVRPNETGTLKEAIEIIWAKKQTYTDEDILTRSEDVVLRALKNGTLNIRTHVDVDTIGGLKPLQGILKLKEKYRGLVDIQIVAFPQEGIIKDPGCEDLLYQAMELGADVIGGMPANEATPDDSRAHVKIIFDIAEKYDCDVDMHVDETDDPFYRTLEMVADETIRRGWHSRVTAGHTCALAAYDDHYAGYVIQKLRQAQIHMITNPVTNLMLQGRNDKQPIRRGITRVKELLEAGLLVSFGQDCVSDTFYPLGSADMLQVANVTAHAAQMSLPDEIKKVYDMITGDAAAVIGLEDYGLKVGNKADLIVLDVATERDAIRLAPARLFVIKNGRIVAQTQTETIFHF
ncbi:MAG: amidohydrolase family protein [Tissierellia bacterium]|nr:amidohydrolase family protein [Tissierellia bacterium]